MDAERAPASDERREEARTDRRARPRGGRRDGDQPKPWYLRRPFWLTAASLMYVGWRRVLRRRAPTP